MAAPLKCWLGVKSIETVLKYFSKRVPDLLRQKHVLLHRQCPPLLHNGRRPYSASKHSSSGTSSSGTSSSSSDSASDSGSDDSSSDSDNEPAVTTPPVKQGRLNLAKPSQRPSATRKHANVGEASLDEKLAAAAKSVAQSLGGSTEQTESDLLAQLRAHARGSTGTQPTPSPTKSISSLFSSMEIEKEGVERPDPVTTRSGKKTQTAMSRKPAKSEIPNITLANAEPLGIFRKESVEISVDKKSTTLFDRIEQEELEKLGNLPPNSAFEEMIQWTKEGKLWTFPINNEAGLEDTEGKISFQEHVFLDHLLEPFPKKGPIRHFMELVVTGMSKNPYMTVQQKHEHVSWFENYFNEKKRVLDETIQI